MVSFNWDCYRESGQMETGMVGYYGCGRAPTMPRGVM